MCHLVSDDGAQCQFAAARADRPESLGADGVGGLTAIPVMTQPVYSAASWVKQGAGVDNKSKS